MTENNNPSLEIKNEQKNNTENISGETNLTTMKKEDQPEMLNVEHPPCTPGVTKARQSRLEFKVQSPSDALMSPCTKMLAGGGSKKPKNAISHPQNVLRNKHHKDLLRKLPED